jgi:hypothetical protein
MCSGHWLNNRYSLQETLLVRATIKSEMERLYPDYLHVASLTLSEVLDLNIDDIAGEISRTSIS